MSTMEKLYTPEEVAEYLQMNPSVIRRKLFDGSLKGFKVGNLWRIKESDLQEFINNGK